jgi:hypothetical protein
MRAPRRPTASREKYFHHPLTISATNHGQFLLEQLRGEFFVGLSKEGFLELEFANCAILQSYTSNTIILRLQSLHRVVAERAIKQDTTRPMQNVLVWEEIKLAPPAWKRRVSQNQAGGDSEGKAPLRRLRGC